MSDIAIKFENIAKQYRLGTIGTGTLSHDINRWWHLVRGKEDPYLKIGEVNDRSQKANSKYVWALKDISFDVKQGEVLGIIGKNGAGKSTLLKILSRVTSPTVGEIKAKGRIASLLEVGTGFHPEMTGRQNIYMNGSIMGMTRHEIKSKLDEIVDFAGVEKYIDTPVKRYSSGMMVRLGFAVAAHLEPEILVVDEVLAVGDAEFQKKAIGKMKDVSLGGGRTVLFVSHNLDAVKKLCNTGLLLRNGSIYCQGEINDVLNIYVSDNKKIMQVEFNKKIDDNLILNSIYLTGDDNEIKDTFMIGEKWKINVHFEVTEGNLKNVVFATGLNTNLDTPISTTWSEPQNLPKGTYTISFENDSLFLQKGNFKLIVGISKGNESLFYNDSSLEFSIDLISKTSNDNLIKIDGTTGLLMNQFNVEVCKG
ncbi:polysaccharide ABC transporter ATP-binding protein [Dysgonomonas sp. 520]|uniref:ABC transporter ATP-binding protein n=1 Tax=Dysgonomonas sp. 520 TaxID=2302931 RepID=UPI0013D74AD9|nr:polysaccharide ABC transporter ATP-binding protein [Dysgonomonas sp. 520]NDW09797.1 ATP-binding cassette domain-containing protein [Dysgonomonas sp. 520]